MRLSTKHALLSLAPIMACVFSVGCKTSKPAQTEYAGVNLAWTRTQTQAALKGAGIKFLTKPNELYWGGKAMYSVYFGPDGRINSIVCVAGICDPILGITRDMDLRAIMNKLGEPTHVVTSDTGYIYQYKEHRVFFLLNGGQISLMGIAARSDA